MHGSTDHRVLVQDYQSCFGPGMYPTGFGPLIPDKNLKKGWFSKVVKDGRVGSFEIIVRGALDMSKMLLLRKVSLNGFWMYF